MIAVTHPVASRAVHALANVKRLFRRCECALVEAKKRRIQHKIEFHRRLDHYRHANAMPLLNWEDFRGRF